MIKTLAPEKVTEYMKSFELFKYKKLLKEYLLAVTEEISESDSNKQVYAIALEFDPWNETIFARWNNESSFESTLKNYKERSPEQFNTSKEITALKYNSGDFSYNSKVYIRKFSEFVCNQGSRFNQIAEELDGEYDDGDLSNDYENFMLDFSADVINSLSNELNGIDKTEGFIFYIALNDARIDKHYYVMRKTVPEKRIEKFRDYFCGFLD